MLRPGRRLVEAREMARRGALLRALAVERERLGNGRELGLEPVENGVPKKPIDGVHSGVRLCTIHVHNDRRNPNALWVNGVNGLMFITLRLHHGDHPFENNNKSMNAPPPSPSGFHKLGLFFL